MSSFKTKAGTELPLINLKGKEYLEVKYRIVWFREERPTWRIETEPVNLTEKYSLFKASIKDEHGHIMATSHKSETSQGFADHAEKAETGAIGRALALIGYGTQFAPEFDEGDRVVDSPRNKPVKPVPTPQPSKGATMNSVTGPQLTRLHTLKTKHGITDKQITDYLGSIGLESTKDLSKDQYETLCKKILATPPPQTSR